MRLHKEQKYKIAIGILLLVVILEGVFIIISRPKKPVKIPVAIKGKIAIVIDDWGYNSANLEILDQIKYPLTCSVLPGLRYSKKISQELHSRGCQIILHLPMEPRERYRLEKNTIMTAWAEAEIVKTLEKDLDSIVYAQGVSNHMGSKATEDARVMTAVFKDLKKKHLYFLDSFVSPNSVCANLSRKIGLGFIQRDIFLDNTPDPAYIRGQVYKLKIKAKIFGQAVGIGHERKNTLEILKEVMPELADEGYKFVFVSELIR